jgi:hypothetical protein
MVTSATSGEGKTSLACHLATSLARSGLKTLLIDCHHPSPLRHPGDAGPQRVPPRRGGSWRCDPGHGRQRPGHHHRRGL